MALITETPDRFRPRLTLHTLTRGDGILGLRPGGLFGPRGGNVTVACIDWTYVSQDGSVWETPAPTSHRNDEPVTAYRLQVERLLQRNAQAEMEALDVIREMGFHSLPAKSLQWRSPAMATLTDPLWSLLRENDFGDFWADSVPVLQELGWSIVVRPGFAHESVLVDAWRFIVSPESGEVLGKEIASPLPGRPPDIGDFGQPGRAAWWLLTLGVEIAGQSFDLVPMLSDLLRRDARWHYVKQMSAIPDKALISLRAVGGKRINAPAGPLKIIVAAMLDLLTNPRRKDGPIRVSLWDACRLDDMCLRLGDDEFSQSAGAMQIHSDADLRALGQRLQQAGEPPPVASPAGLGITLRPYQLQGVAWLQYLREHRLAGILADDMGLGKTAQVLAHILIEKQSGRLNHPALVVLPTSLVFNWQAETRRMTPDLTVLALHGTDRESHFASIAQYDVVLTTYPLIWRDLDALMRQQFHLLILDEAQIVKNASGRSASAVRRLRAHHRLCVTGTPMENNLGELWTQFNFLMPGFLGDAGSFTRLWRKPIEENGATVRAHLLAQRVRPFILRRRKETVAAELPSRTLVTKLLRLEGRQRALYESVRVASDKQVRRVLERRGFTGSHVTIMDALLKLRQVCCDPFLLKGDKTPKTIERAKIDMLREMLPALVAEGRYVLVFSQFTEMLELIERELDLLNLPWLSLTGKTPPAQRGELVATFQNRSVPILLISLKAGGVGLNLTAADTVILVDPWWNPAAEEQAIARAHRIGQQRNVFIYRLVVEGSIEERILELQARKSALAEAVLGNDPALSAKFSVEELTALMAPLSMVDQETR